MGGVPHLDGNRAGRLSNDTEATQHVLTALDEHLNEMSRSGRTVQNIREKVAATYVARSSQSHCEAIDDWLAIHARITQATQNFHQGTHLTNLALKDAEGGALGLAGTIHGKINP